MTLGIPTTLATMTPIDWGITGAAILMLVYAARTFVSGKGKSQMGASFAFVAALVWTLALGRHLDGFDFLDGLRVAIGVLLLVPVIRVAFSHTGGSIVFAVTSLILASVIAGPVVSRFAGQLTEPGTPHVDQLNVALEGIDESIKEKTGTRDAVLGLMGEERAKLEATGLKTAAEVESNEEAFAALRKYAGYKDQLDSLSAQISDLQGQKREIERSLATLESGTDPGSGAQAEAERIRRLVEAEAARDKPLIERYSERGNMLELFETEFGDPDSQ